MKSKLYILITLSVLVGFTFSCDESVLDPTLAQDKPVEGSINVAEDVQGILYGAYNRLTATSYYGRDLIIFGEVRSDNTFSNGNSGRFLTPSAMDMGDNDGFATGTWTAIYDAIASTNILINLDLSTIEGDAAQINHYVGQAHAIRALAHFDLLKLYGQQHTGGSLGVPYITEFKSENITPARGTVTENRASIEADLATALSMMSESLNDGSKELITTHAVQALRSRVALYFKDYQTVIQAAEAVINSGQYQIIEADAYIASWQNDASVNSIFELAYNSTDNNNINGLQYIYRGPNYGDIEVLDDILTIFDETDVRVDPAMIGMGDGTGVLRNMGKYPAADYSDNIPLIRYEEVILNYAEALMETGNTAGALEQLNSITAKRNAQPYAVVSQDNILQERRRELCFEGFRFDDLARTGRDIPLVDPLKQTHGGPAYGSYNYAFPIPLAELNANANMVQNGGYK